MKILLITPDARMHKLYFGDHVRSCREAPLTLTTLAALTRDSPEFGYKLVDESVDAVPLGFPADLVGISVLTGTARRAYALADHFRRRKIPVVLGGVHVSMCPTEAAAFADSIVVGMAEHTWPRLLADFRAGQMAPRYDPPPAEGPDDFVPGLPTPRWELLRRSGYMVPYTVQFTRGCVHACDFCSVPVVWRKFQRRPVADIIRDIKRVPGQRFAVSDVSPFDDVEWAKELLTAMIPLEKKWGALATTRITDDPDLVDLLVKAGCSYLLIGFESTNQGKLRQIYKGFNRSAGYEEVVRILHQGGITIQGCFVFGFDDDTTEVFAATVAEVQTLGIDIPRYSIYTPYPGTPLFRRLESEGRILSYDWGDYDTMHVVHRPNNMSPVELYEGFRWAYKETFKWRDILERTIASGWNAPITLAGNITYRNYARRLYRERAFEMPVSSSVPRTNSQCADLPMRSIAASWSTPAARLSNVQAG